MGQHAKKSQASPQAEMGEAGEKALNDSSAKPLGARLKAAILAMPRGTHLLLFVICLILGIALVTQVRAQRTDPLTSLSQEELVELLDNLSVQEQNLRVERGKLESQVSQLEDESQKEEAAANAAKKAEEQAKINSGQVAVHGPGIEMVISDPSHSLNATHFVMALGELRNAGSEASEINGHRVTVSSSFTSDGGVISVDGQALSSPYVWKVIGDSQTISTALEIQAGSAAQMRAKGASVTITQMKDLKITSISTPKSPEFAKQIG